MSEFDFIFSEEKASEDFVYSHNLSAQCFSNQTFNYNIKTDQKTQNDQSKQSINLVDQSNNLQINNTINTDSIQPNGMSENVPINPTTPLLTPQIIIPHSNTEYLEMEKENPFVKAEKQKVENNLNLTTKINNLRKTYWKCCGKNVRAVNDFYLGLEANEKLGLLGYNGSGKTTVIKSIINEILFDHGEITLFGKDNKKEFDEVRKIIGYCPQANPLFDYMKVREIVQFYSDMKNCNNSITEICNKFGLEKYLDTYCINLSGGNKRKLTFAIALMNEPKILLLDEPSTGVDPESRRVMWKNINALSKKDQFNMILTTHSTEEAEVLCDSISWLKRGNFRCIGNPEKLKIQFSKGYKLHVKFIDLKSEAEIEGFDDIYIKISNLLNGVNKYSNFIKANKAFHPYVAELLKVLEMIQNQVQLLNLIEIRKDLSFELEIDVIKQFQGELFGNVLNMKNTNNKLSEISITMESLENILTSI